MPSAQSNRDLYETRYPLQNMRWPDRLPYDRRYAQLRLDLVWSVARDADVLDVGCGTGAFLRPAGSIARCAVGVDFSRRVLDEAVADGSFLTQGDATRLPFADNSFDVVYSFATLYVVPDLARALSEIARVVRPGGTAILELGNSRSLNGFVS